MIWALTLLSERETSSCDHCSEKGATVSKAEPPTIPSMPSFFMIDLPDDIAMDGGAAVDCSPRSQRSDQDASHNSINMLLVSFDSEVRKRGCRTMMRTPE